MYLTISIIIIIVLIIFTFISLKLFELYLGKINIKKEISNIHIVKNLNLETVKELSILPLIDFYTKDNKLKTEAGVSYLIKADDVTILMDLGLNNKKEHPSPLLTNMKILNVSFDDIDMIYLSHIHGDHIGGIKERKNGTFSFSQGKLELPEIPVFSPEKITPSKFNPNFKVDILTTTKIITNGIASVGPIPRYLFMLGHTLEQCLAVNIKGKGIVLIVGCGHQGIDKIIEITKKTFNLPIYGIVGGLHLPVQGGRIMAGPINLQNIFGSDKFPIPHINKIDALNSIGVIKKENIKLIALSAHDSSDWIIEKFKKDFSEQYIDLLVGKEINITC